MLFEFEIPAAPIALKIGGHVSSLGLSGAVGGFIDGNHGLILALTAAHLLDFGANESLKDSDNQSVACIVEQPSTSAGPEPFFKTIGLATVAPYVAIDATADFYPSMVAPFDAHLLDANVAIVRASGIAELGTIVGYKGALRLKPHGGGEPQLYYDSIEVRGKSVGGNGTLPGDGGALAITENGVAIGIVIGALGQRIFLAPLAPLAAERSLRFLTKADFNKQATFAKYEVASRQFEVGRPQLEYARQTFERLEREMPSLKTRFGAGDVPFGNMAPTT